MLALNWEAGLKHPISLFVDLCGFVRMKILSRNIGRKLPITSHVQRKSEIKKLPADEGG